MLVLADTKILLRRVDAADPEYSVVRSAAE